MYHTSPESKQPTMSEEYVMLQYQNEQLKKDLAYWMKVASDAVREKNEHIAPLSQKIDELVLDNDEYRRTNDRIWETAKTWIKEDSEIISKQASQIKYLVAKVKSLEKKGQSGEAAQPWAPQVPRGTDV